jgi:uncharacterized protein (TIGR03437 family)
MHRSVLRLAFVLSLAILSAAPQAARAAVTVAAAVNVASYTRPEMPNGKLAQGVMFTLFGTDMGPAALAQASTFPLPTSLAGTSVQVTVNGTTVDCIMIFTLASRVAAILPSSTPVGAGTLTVTFNGVTSPPLAIEVVANGFGIFTTASNGVGQASITDPLAGALRLNGFFEAAHPGEPWDIWGTGLGAVAADESIETGAGDLTHLNVEVYVGGKKAQVVYRGRSGCCSALDQIRIIIPEGVEGCAVSVVVIVNGVPSNNVTMSIAAEGNVCSDSFGPSAADLDIFQSSGQLNFGQLFVARTWSEINLNGQVTVQRNDTAAATFSGLDLAQSSQLASLTPAVGSCVVNPLPGPTIIPSVGLDAGGGTFGPYTLNQITPGTHMVFFAPQLPTGPGVVNDGTLIDAGTYTFNINGGADVGAFSASLDVPTPVVWTNREQLGPINLNQPLTITWSNGVPGGIVQIIGISPSALGNSGFIGAQFQCRAPADAGTFTVPAWVFGSLPPSISIGGNPGGTITVGLYGFGDRIDAPGIGYGLIWYIDSFLKAVDYR